MDSEKGVTAEPNKPIFKATILKNNSKKCFFGIGTLVIVTIITLIITIVLLIPKEEDCVNPMCQYSNESNASEFVKENLTISDIENATIHITEIIADNANEHWCKQLKNT